MTAPGYHKPLTAVPPPPAWMDRAACLDADPEWWHPVAASDDTSAARAICRECPVRVDCLDHALAVGARDGIWGGVDMEREKPRRMA